MQVTEGKQYRYILGMTRSRNPQPILGKHPVLVVRVLPGGRVILRTSPDEFTRPSQEFETWLTRVGNEVAE